MVKIVTVIGARPQFIKAAVLSRLMHLEPYSADFKEFIIHTGQHYDQNMSAVFFEEMAIPAPQINLGIGGKSHGAMTGEMLIAIEKILMDIKPDLVLVYGDTDSTLAGALAAGKLLIPIAHVEAGLRSHVMAMPEEQNRILTDHLASWLLAPTATAAENLAKENVHGRIHITGDIMYDAHLFYRPRAQMPPCAREEPYFLATVHRAENTDNKANLENIFAGLSQIKERVILPLHPRTRQKCQTFGLNIPPNIKVLEPVGYLEMLGLELNAKAIITDSGGVQKEAYFCQKPCITLRSETEWVETVTSGWNTLAATNGEAIAEAAKNLKIPQNYPPLYGDGHCGEKILKILG